MGFFPELVEGAPFVWTIICCIAVYAFGLPLYASDTQSEAIRVVVSCVWGVLALIVSLGTLSYLFRAFLEPRKFFHENGDNGKRSSLLNLLFFFDVWFALLTMQAAVLYIPYMFDPVNAFLAIGSANGPWYVYMEIFVTACNNFHGASNVGVDAISVVPMIWLSICSIVARMYTWFAVAILVRLTLLNRGATVSSKRMM